MKNNNILVNALCLTVIGLMCFGALGDEAYATQAYAEQRCPATPITVVNQSIHSVIIEGEGSPIVIAPKSAIATTVQSKYFYSHCGLIHLSLNSTTTKIGLIDSKSKKVEISIRPNDAIDEVGMTAQGFDLDNYLSWHGYKGVL